MKSGVLLTLFILCTIAHQNLSNAQQPGSANQGQVTMTKVENQNIPGGDYKNFVLKPGETCEKCIEECLKDPNCKAYTYVKPGVQGPEARCWLKSSVSNQVNDANCISGIKEISFRTQGYVIKPNKIMTVSEDALGTLKWSPEDGPMMKSGVNLQGSDYRSFFIPKEQDQVPQVCLKEAIRDPRCEAWTFVEPGVQGPTAACWFKNKIPAIKSRNDSCISGIRLQYDYTPKAIPEPSKLKPEIAKANLKSFDREYENILNQTIGDINLRYRKLQQEKNLKQLQMYNRVVMQQVTPAALPDPIPNPALAMQYGLQGQLVSAKYKGKEISFANADPKLKIPVLNSVHALLTDPVKQKAKESNTIYEGHYIIIYGKNFGKASLKCGLRLNYCTEVPENMNPGITSTSICYSYDLIPYQNSWEQSWFDDFIVARVPKLAGVPTGKKSLKIWKEGDDGFVLEKEVNVLLFGPGLQYIHTVPAFEEGHIASNAQITIAGSGFGIPKGKVEIDCPEINKKWKLETDWTETLIRAKAPDFELDTIFDAKMYIENGDGRKIMNTIKIGPVMTDFWISGKMYAELYNHDRADEGHVEQKDNNDVFAVSHYPGCGTPFTSGNNGSDYYFKDAKMLPNFRLSGYFYYPIDCFNWEDELKWALNQFANMIFSPWSFFTDVLGLAIISLFDSGAGIYEIKLEKAPTPDNPLTEIHFHNACTGPFDGVPNKYLISFRLRGPEKQVLMIQTLDKTLPYQIK
jgi:hypothetical protein